MSTVSSCKTFASRGISNHLRFRELRELRGIITESIKENHRRYLRLRFKTIPGVWQFSVIFLLSPARVRRLHYEALVRSRPRNSLWRVINTGAFAVRYHAAL